VSEFRLIVKFRYTNFRPSFFYMKSRDSSVDIALDYGLDDRGSRVRFPAGAGNFSLHHHIQNGSGAHQVFYPIDTRCSFPGGKAAAEAWSWPLTSIQCRGQECAELYLHYPNMSSWLVAQLKHRDKFNLPLPYFSTWFAAKFLLPNAFLFCPLRKKAKPQDHLKICHVHERIELLVQCLILMMLSIYY
jgi:hypothetical protein